MPVCHVIHQPIMIWHISLDNYVKWSSHFLFLFINRLKITWDQRAYLWSYLDLRFVSFYKSNYIAKKIDAEWLQKHCTKCSAKSRNNGNQYSIHIHLCMMHRLLFHESIIVNEAQAPPTGLLCWRNVKLYYITIFDNYAAL